MAPDWNSQIAHMFNLELLVNEFSNLLLFSKKFKHTIMELAVEFELKAFHLSVNN